MKKFYALLFASTLLFQTSAFSKSSWEEAIDKAISGEVSAREEVVSQLEEKISDEKNYNLEQLFKLMKDYFS